MAQYKVIQDIEAEDKLLGPLSLRQFIYAIIVVVLGFVAYRLVLVKWFLAIPFIPPIVFFGLLAAPFGGQQSSEVWLLAKIRFMLYPRRRIWDQDGAQELVTITAPKQVEQHLTKGFSQDEVHSRLKALASTLDTRGWAVKDAVGAQVGPPVTGAPSDRLIDINNLPQSVPAVEIKSSDDVLDAQANPVAQQMDAMIAQSEQEHHQELLDKMRTMTQAQAAQTPPVQQAQPLPPSTATNTAPVPTPQPTAPATAQQPLPTSPIISAPTPPAVPKVSPVQQSESYQAPIPQTPAPTAPQPQSAAPTKQPPSATSMTSVSDTGILQDVKEGASTPDSISLHSPAGESDQDEVVISLH